MFGQLPNTKQYLKRVKDAGGTVRNDVQLALNQFTKKIYKEGLRSTNGGNHIVKHCNVFPTETKDGSKFNLWFVNTAINHDDTGYTYSLTDGASIFDVINTGFNTLDSSLNDGHMGWFITEPYADVALIGFNNTTSDRMMCHPNGYGGFYMDWGSTASDARTLYSISDPTTVLGLDIATKSGSQARHVLNGAVVKTTTLATNKTVSAGEMIFNTYNSGGAYTDLKMAGFTFGADIPNAKLATYRDAWISLQSTIAQERDPAYTPPVPTPKLWLDASDVSTLRNSANGQVTNGGFIRSWVDKAQGRVIFTQSSSNTIQHFDSYDGVRFLTGSTAGYFQHGSGFYFGTIAIVFTPESSSNAASSPRGLMGHSGGGGFNAICLGSKTSWLTNEVIAFYGDGRLGYESSSFTFSANQRYMVIMSRTGNRTGLININGVNVTATPANQGSNLSAYNNVAFALGSNYGTEQFTHRCHEVRIYEEIFTQTEVNTLASILTSKWGI